MCTLRTLRRGALVSPDNCDGRCVSHARYYGDDRFGRLQRKMNKPAWFPTKEGERMAVQETKLVVVDSHPVMAMGGEQLLSKVDGCRVVKRATSALAVMNNPSLEWDIAVLELDLPDGSGLGFLDHIRRFHPDRRAVIYPPSPAEQLGSISMARGASAYISKREDPEMLVQAVEHAVKGQRFVTPAIADVLVNHGAGRSTLTHRETELLQLLASGLRPSAIAECLHITRATVSGHLSSARKKLGARSNVELVRLYERRAQGLDDAPTKVSCGAYPAR